MSETVQMKGNEAIAEAAILAGCRHYFGYPITPQTEVAAYMAKKMPKIGGTFLQAESEIAAINMVYGVASTGHPAMTSSSSPGISLKAEGISYLAGADLPALIINVQRGGPGHGDFHVLVFAPSSVQEMADLTGRALHLAWKYRMPAMLLADGTMGQMMEPVNLPEPSNAFGDDNPWAAIGTEMKRPHNIINSLDLSPENLEKQNFARFERYKKIEESECLWEEYMMDDAEICIVACGITARVSRNAIVEARKQGIKVGMLRPITLWPFPKKAMAAAAEKVNAFLCVEMNMGQMKEDVELAIRCRKPVELCCRVGGMIPTPDEVLEHIKKIAEGGKEA